MFNIGIVSVKFNKSIELLIESANDHPKIGKVALLPPQEFFIEVDRSIRIRSSGHNLRDFDLLLLRGMNQETTPTLFFDVLKFLRDEEDIPSINSVKVLRKLNSKFQTSAVLADANLPTPTLIVTQQLTDIKRFVDENGIAAIKPIYRSKAIDIIRVTDRDFPEEEVAALLAKYKALMVQEYVENSGYDIRILVMGDEIPAIYARKAPAASWITNVSSGGTPFPYALNPDLEKLALDAANVLGMDYGGLDIFETDNGYTILEANGSPDLKDIKQIQDVDLAGKLIDYSVRKLES
jgi:RimK family alpha-L-glutamate ligase